MSINKSIRLLQANKPNIQKIEPKRLI